MTSDDHPDSASALQLGREYTGQVSGWKASRRGEESAPLLDDIPLYVTGTLGSRETRHGTVCSLNGVDVAQESLAPMPPDDHPRWDEFAPEKGDCEWQRRLRRHQAWYREVVLGLPPGEIATASGSRPVASRLPAWAVSSDPTLNLLCDFAIDDAVRARVAQPGGGIIEMGRLRHNLLSSQPLCFNLFVPLDEFADVKAALLRDGFGVEADGFDEIKIEFEHAPAIGDGKTSGSAFDCFISYRRGDRRGFVGIETKYAENVAAQKVSVNPMYAEWTSAPGSGYREGASTELAKPATSQLWYNAVLAQRLLAQEDYTEGRVVLLCCADDEAAGAAGAAFAAQLEDPDDFFAVQSYEAVMGAIPERDELDGWRTHFTQRYLGLRPSA